MFATTETIRTVLVHLFSEANGLDSDPEWLFRITAGTATGIIFFSLVSVVVNDSQYYRQAYRNLFEQRLILNAALSSAETNVERTRMQMLQNVRDQLEKALRVTLREMETQTSATIELSNDIYEVAEMVVRPLSHQLFAEPVKVPETQLSIKPPRVPIAQFVRDSSIADPFRPGLLVFIGTLLTLPVLFLFTSWISVLNWAVGLGLTFVVLFFANKYVTSQLPKMPVFIRFVLITLIFMAPAIFFAGSVINAVTKGNPDNFATIFYGSAIVVFLGWLLAASAGMRASRQSMLTQVSEMNNEIYLGDIENSIECHLQRLSATEKKVMHWLANQTEAVEKFPKTANLDLSTSEFWAAIQSLMRRCLLDKLPSETSSYFPINPVFKSYLQRNPND